MRAWLLSTKSKDTVVTLSQLRTLSSTPDVGHTPHDTARLPWHSSLAAETLAESPRKEGVQIGGCLAHRELCLPITGMTLLVQGAPPPRTRVLPGTPRAPSLGAENYLGMFDLAFTQHGLWNSDF